jgi:hypothetical protein
MVAFDNTILSVLLFPDAELQEGPDATPVERARERVNALVQEIADGGEQVLVPSPALAEVLATPDCDMEEVLSTLRVSAFIRIGDFDQRAAVELAIRLRNAAAAGDHTRRFEDHENEDEVRPADRGNRSHEWSARPVLR